jgi:hypothetical protein
MPPIRLGYRQKLPNQGRICLRMQFTQTAGKEQAGRVVAGRVVDIVVGRMVGRLVATAAARRLP